MASRPFKHSAFGLGDTVLSILRSLLPRGPLSRRAAIWQSGSRLVENPVDDGVVDGEAGDDGGEVDIDQVPDDQAARVI